MEATVIMRVNMAATKIGSATELAKRTGIKKATMCNRFKNVRSMTVGELQEIARVTHMSDEHIAELVRNA